MKQFLLFCIFLLLGINYSISQEVVTLKCTPCNGSGKCMLCRGSGMISSIMGMTYCPGCMGSGRCISCQGLGIVTRIYTPTSTSTSTPKKDEDPSKSTEKACRLCKGSGIKIKEVWMGGSQTKWCETCKKNVYIGHQHVRCDICKGTGYITY